MKMYYEVIFILNYLLDFMILFGTKRILKINRNIYRIFIGSLIGSLTTFLLFININNIELFILKIVLAFIIVFISFGKDRLLYNTFYFYILSILVGGFIYLFDFNSNYYFHIIFLIGGCFFIVYITILEISHYKEKIVNEYIVDIYYQNKKYSLRGFIDTGNRLVSPYNKECILLTNLELDINKVIYVPYKALNTSGVIPCIRPDKVIINNKYFNNCLVALSKDKFEINGISCILPNKFKEELC